MEKEIFIEKLDESKVQLMRNIRKQIKELRSNLVMLQSGNGGIISPTMDDLAFNCRVANGRLDDLLKKSIEYHRIYG